MLNQKTGNRELAYIVKVSVRPMVMVYRNGITH